MTVRSTSTQSMFLSVREFMKPSSAKPHVTKVAGSMPFPGPLLITVCCIVAAALMFASAGRTWAAQPSERTLPNGVQLIIVPDPTLQLTAVDVWVRAGSAFESPGEIGAAHFLEHVLFKGTPTCPAGQIDEAIENVGATLNAATSKDWVHFYTTVATQYLDTALSVISDALQHPLFDPTQVNLEARVIKAEISDRRDDPTQVLADALAQGLYGSHPYGRPVYATVDDVSKLTPSVLRAFHKRTYVGSAMVVVVVGNVDPPAAFQKLSRLFGSVPGPGEAPPWPSQPTLPPQAVTIDLPKAPGPYEWLGAAFLGPGIDTPRDVWAMDVLSSLLARDQAGRLYDRLVSTDKIAQGVDTDFLTTRLRAMVSITAAVSPGKTQDALAAIRQEIAQIKLSGVTDDELQQAKRYLLGTYAFQVETAGGQTGSLGFYAILGDAKDSLEYQRHVQEVTATDVQRVAKDYLNFDHAVTVRLSK